MPQEISTKKWPKNDLKLPKIAQIGPKMTQNGPKISTDISAGSATFCISALRCSVFCKLCSLTAMCFCKQCVPQVVLWLFQALPWGCDYKMKLKGRQATQEGKVYLNCPIAKKGSTPHGERWEMRKCSHVRKWKNVKSEPYDGQKLILSVLGRWTAGDVCRQTQTDRLPRTQTKSLQIHLIQKYKHKYNRIL